MDSVQTKTTRWVGGRCPQHLSRDKNIMTLGHIQNDDSKEPIPRRESAKRQTGIKRPKVAPASASAAAWRAFIVAARMDYPAVQVFHYPRDLRRSDRSSQLCLRSTQLCTRNYCCCHNRPLI